jgi:recombinational DNA repair protein RecT
MKCKDCTAYDCTYRDKDGNTKCYYETPYWNHFRAEAAKDILCSMINHFGTSNIDMNDVVKWTDSLISKLKEKEVRNE